MENKVNLYLDIETIPAQRPDVMEEIKATIKPPAVFKKPESIAEWMRTEGPGAAEEAYRKTGLDGAYGQICVVGLASNGNDPIAICELDWQDPRAEQRILKALCGQLTEWIAPSETFTTCVIGHNVSAFDLRFLSQRSIINGIRPHTTLARAAQAKPWEGEKVFDTMVQWTGSASVRISLDKLCKALSIPTPKDGITGATVWDAVKDGRIGEVAAYCLRDVIATREAHKRMTFQSVQVA